MAGDQVPFTTDVLGNLELKDLPEHPRGILAERINTIKFIVRIALGDGNCLFRSISLLLYLTQDFYMDVRKVLVDEMVKHPLRYRNYARVHMPEVAPEAAYEEYVNNMYNDKVWGDTLVIHAAANLYRVRVFVVKSFEDYVVEEVSPYDRKYKKDIVLSYLYVNHTEAHYNAMFPPQDAPEMNPYRFKIFIGNLPKSVSRDDLKDKCSLYGEVSEARIEFQRGRPYGYVWTGYEDDMLGIIAGMDSQDWRGRKIKAEKAKGNPYNHV